jgi:fatty-acyl-CoA synthase
VLVVDGFSMIVTGEVRKVEMRAKSVDLLGLHDVAAVHNA